MFPNFQDDWVVGRPTNATDGQKQKSGLGQEKGSYREEGRERAQSLVNIGSVIRGNRLPGNAHFCAPSPRKRLPGFLRWLVGSVFFSSMLSLVLHSPQHLIAHAYTAAKLAMWRKRQTCPTRAVKTRNMKNSGVGSRNTAYIYMY